MERDRLSRYNRRGRADALASVQGAAQTLDEARRHVKPFRDKCGGQRDSKRNLAMIDRYQGCLLGLAVGDALGTTLEFRAPGSFDPIDDMVGGGKAWFRLRDTDGGADRDGR